MEQWETTAHLGIGSNEDSPQERCIEGIQKLSLINAIRLIQCSNFYRTEPVGLKNQEWFINAVLEIRTGLSPYDLLSALQNIEWEMGRVKTACTICRMCWG